VLINNSLNENELIMLGFQPGSKNDARLRLENVAYSSLTQWLYDLEYRHGINIEDLSLTPSKFSGRLMVSVRVSN
jgi:general secretion pathway protein M